MTNIKDLLKVEILSRDRAHMYTELFNVCTHAFAQQSIEWSDVIAPLSPDTPYFLVASRASDATALGGLPLYHYEGPQGGILTSVPHAGPLGGVFYQKDLNKEVRKTIYKALINKGRELALELKCISLTVITNPFHSDAHLYNTPIPPDYIFNNFTQVIDLRSLFTPEGIYNTGKSRYNNHINKNMRKAERAGIKARWGDEKDFDTWYDIHKKRHKELNTLPLPRELLSGILTVMREKDMGGLGVLEIEDKIIGGCFYIWNKEIVDAFIMSCDSAYFNFGVNHAITDFATRYFHSRGFRLFNWQSCKRDSGVYAFKVRWGSVEKDYHILTWTFEGFDKVFSAGADEISKGYAWHYVAPFEAIKNKTPKGVFDKT